MKFQEVPESGSGNGKNYLKFKDKESITLVVVGNPVTYHAVWQNNRYEICPPDTPKATMRFRANVVYKDREENRLVSKIWEGPKRLYKQLKDLNDEYDLDTIFVKVTRYGTGTDTEYNLLPAKEKRSKETDKSISTIQLQVLSVPETEPTALFDADEEIPF